MMLPLTNTAAPPFAQVLYKTWWAVVALSAGVARPSVMAAFIKRFLMVWPQGKVSGCSIMV